MERKAAPLQGVRVLNLGGVWAGRVAAMLLADQGAEVVEIARPNREGLLEDALLARGIAVASLALKNSEGQERLASAWTIPESASATPRWSMCPFPTLPKPVRLLARSPGKARSQHRWEFTPTFTRSGRFSVGRHSSRCFPWRPLVAACIPPSRGCWASCTDSRPIRSSGSRFRSPTRCYPRWRFSS